ncbi:MAG: hypothetical protein M3P18_16010 [Actinomycetota bacterium]|nr:hypothetical protein [Actinomycetota bacterium]
MSSELLAALRLERRRHARVSGPDQDGRVVVRDDEAAPGEARARLANSLDTAGADWSAYLELQEPNEAEVAAWARRRATQQPLARTHE